MGLFQEDKVIQVHKLINLQEQHTKDVECVANEYILDLISRSLLIASSKSSGGEIKACRIHNLLREFCLAKSAMNIFSSCYMRKMFLIIPWMKLSHIYLNTTLEAFFCSKSSPLFSIHISGIGTSSPCNISPNSFCNAKFLHVLDLEDAKFVDDFPEEITTLFLLRYLAIQCNTKFIPATIARLEKLQILCIIGKDLFVFSAEILRMESLRHVYFLRKFITIQKLKSLQEILGFAMAESIAKKFIFICDG